MRYQPIDENSALAHKVPAALNGDPGYSLIRELQIIDQDHSKFLRALAEENHNLEAYLKGINKKIEVLAAKLMESEESVSEQEKKSITLSEGGLSFHSATPHAHDSYMAVRLTLLPSHIALMLFCRVINCSAAGDDYAIALSFVHLKDSDRQIIAKHIMQQQLAQRRQQNNDQDTL